MPNIFVIVLSELIDFTDEWVVHFAFGCLGLNDQLYMIRILHLLYVFYMINTSMNCLR